MGHLDSGATLPFKYRNGNVSIKISIFKGNGFNLRVHPRCHAIRNCNVSPTPMQPNHYTTMRPLTGSWGGTKTAHLPLQEMLNLTVLSLCSRCLCLTSSETGAATTTTVVMNDNYSDLQQINHSTSLTVASY